MASVAFHNMNQFLEHGHVRLVRGLGRLCGRQSRDFISVEDVVAVNLHFLDNPGVGHLQLGTGRAQPFNDVAAAVVNTLRAERGEAGLSLAQLVELDLIRYIPFPDDLKGRYQSLQADVSRLRAAGFTAPMRDVQTGVAGTLLARPQVSRCRMPALPSWNKPPPCLVMPAVFSWKPEHSRHAYLPTWMFPFTAAPPAAGDRHDLRWRDNRRVRFLSGDPHACIRCSIQRLVPAGRHSLHPEAGVRPPSGAAPAVRASGRRRPASA